LAVGDVVSFIGDANADLDITPAVGVAFVLTYLDGQFGFVRIRESGGDESQGIKLIDANEFPLIGGIKLMVTNTNFVRMTAGGAAVHQHASGIEIN